MAPIEHNMDDVRAVLDAAGSERAIVYVGSGLGFSSCGSVALEGVPGEWELFEPTR